MWQKNADVDVGASTCSHLSERTMAIPHFHAQFPLRWMPYGCHRFIVPKTTLWGGTRKGWEIFVTGFTGLVWVFMFVVAYLAGWVGESTSKMTHTLSLRWPLAHQFFWPKMEGYFLHVTLNHPYSLDGDLWISVKVSRDFIILTWGNWGILTS